ncbi:MAG: hypothetical protein ACOCVC_06730 [Spirochaeta sp.]
MFSLKCEPAFERGCRIRVRHTWRVFAGAAALFFAAALYEQISIAGVLLVAAFAAAAMYNETWTFNPDSDQVVFRVGIAGIRKTQRRAFSEIVDIRLLSVSEPSTGKRSPDETPQELARRSGNTRLADILSRRMIRLAIYFSDGHSITIQTESRRRYSQLQGLGKNLAECTGIRFREIEI